MTRPPTPAPINASDADALPADPAAGAVAPGLPEPALAAQALGQVLRPLARLMIDHGLQLPAMVDLLKKALVDEAAHGYSLTAKGSTDSRIALLTGVHRKDVKRLRSEASGPAAGAAMMSVASMVVARWISEPRYLNADQSPRPLARTPRRSTPGEPDFTTLVSEISRDVGARAVLDELVRLGTVDLSADGHAVLRAQAFVPKGGTGEAFHFPIANVADHLAAAVHNLAPNRREGLMLEQSAFSEDLSPKQAQLLQQRARQLWAAALKQFLQTAMVAWQRSEGEPGPKRRIRFGVYFHDAEQPPSTAGVAASPKARRKSVTAPQSGDQHPPQNPEQAARAPSRAGSRSRKPQA